MPLKIHEEVALRKKRHTETVMHSSARSDWRTPPAMFKALDAEFSFKVDVAADADNHLSLFWYGPGSSYPDALQIPWDPAAPLFINPPYDKTHPVGPWVEKAWVESQRGCTVVGVLPFSPQTQWYRRWVMGQCAEPYEDLVDDDRGKLWMGHAAMEERRLPHRVSFLLPDGSPAQNAPGNTVVVVWRPNYGLVGPWQPAVRYWSYR